MESIIINKFICGDKSAIHYDDTNVKAWECENKFIAKYLNWNNNNNNYICLKESNNNNINKTLQIYLKKKLYLNLNFKWEKKEILVFYWHITQVIMNK